MPSVTASVVSRATDVVQVGGKSLFQLRHHLLGAVGGLDGVRARQLVEGDEGCGLAVESADHAVRLGPQLDAPHVFDADEGSVCVGADHDVAELLFVFEAALGANGIGELLARRYRLAADLAGGVDGVLLLDGIDDLGDGDAQVGKQVGSHPQAHGVLPGAEDGDAGDSGHAGHLVVDVDVAVVGQEDVVVGPVGGKEGEHDQRRRRRLLHRDALVDHVGGQLRVGLVCPHLGKDLVRVGVRLDVEVHGELHRAVVRVEGIHVVHVVHARHLLLDGRGHGLLHGERVGPGVGGLHLHFRRDDVGELGRGQARHGHKADDDHEDGDHHGHDGAVDEELGHGRLPLLGLGRLGGFLRGGGLLLRFHFWFRFGLGRRLRRKAFGVTASPVGPSGSPPPRHARPA